MVLTIAWMATVATACQTLLVASFSLKLLLLCPLGKLVIARVLTLRLLLLHVLVRRESNPEVLPPFQRVFKSERLSPTQLAIKIPLIDLSLCFHLRISIFSRTFGSLSCPCGDIYIITFLLNSTSFLYHCSSRFWLLNFEGGCTD